MRTKNQQNHQIRNFGFGSRCPLKAAINAVHFGYESQSSIATIQDRLNLFFKSYEELHGQLKDLREIKKEDLLDYAESLKEKLNAGHLATATVHNRISAVNRVFAILRGDDELSVFPSEVGIPNRTCVAKVDRSASLIRLDSEPLGLMECFIIVCRALGLRFEESAKLDLVRAREEASETGAVSLERGTKGGRPRKIPIDQESQIEALETACSFVNGRHCFIPVEMNYVEFRTWMYRENVYDAFHSYRHDYAQAEYERKTGFPPPIKLNLSKRGHLKLMVDTLGISVGEARFLDQRARQDIAEALGHSRIDIVSAYCG